MCARSSTEPSSRVAREATLDVLVEQQPRFGASAARDAQIRRLRDGAGAVVTGQQLGVFLGPAYTLYKAATTIVEARTRDAVPVFWLQSEDHDLDEVRRCHLHDPAGGHVTIELPADAARVSMAHRTLDGAAAAALEQLAAAWDEAPHRDATVGLLGRHFRPGRSWTDAFGGLLGELFPDLVILDPRTSAMARVAAPLHRWAIEEADAIDDLLERRVAELDLVQVPIRRGCLLSFFHPEGPEGPRHRPTRRDGGYCWTGVTAPIGRDALLDALEREPLSCSTSALLRPLLQDLTLPTVATVGGPSELHYLPQVSPLYDALRIEQPEAVRRARFVVTDGGCRRRLDALGLDAEVIEQPEATLLDALVPEGPDSAAVRRALLEPFQAALAALEPRLAELDAELARAVQRTAAHVEKGVDQLGRRVDGARRRQDASVNERLDYLRARLYPGGVPQERVFGFAHLAAWHGPEVLVEAVVSGVGEARDLRELAL